MLSDPESRLRWWVELLAGAAVDLAFLLFVLASVASFLGASWWGFSLVSEFREQLLAAGVGLAVVMALRLQIPFAVAAGLLAGIHLVPVLPYLWDSFDGRGQAEAAPTGGGPLRVMAVNTRRERADAAAVSRLVRGNRPDLVLITEFVTPPLQAFEDLTDIMPYRAGSDVAGIFEILLLSAHPIESVRWHHPTGPSAPIMEARICPPAGCFTAIALHAIPPHADRGRSRRVMIMHAARLAGRARQGRAVLMGDLNTTPYTDIFADALRAGQLRDAARGFRKQPTWRSRTPLAGLAIDHVLIGAGFTARGARVLDDVGSDHFPLLVELSGAGNRPWTNIGGASQ